MASARHVLFVQTTGTWCLGPRLRNSCRPHIQPIATLVDSFRALSTRPSSFTISSSFAGEETSHFCSKACCLTAPFSSPNQKPLQNASSRPEGQSGSAVLRRSTFSSNLLLGSRVVTEFLDGRGKETQSRDISGIAAAYRPADAPGGMEGQAPQVLRPQVKHPSLLSPFSL